MGKSATKCPNCKTPIMLTTIDTPRGNWQNPNRNTFHSVIGGAPAFDDFSEFERREPVGRLVPMDVSTALYEATVTFCIVTFGGVLVVCAAWLSSYGRVYYLCWLPVGAFGFAAVRYFYSVSLAKGLLEKVESIFRQDDKSAEPTAAKPVPLEIKHTNEQGKVIKRTRPTLPDGVTAEMLAEWCGAVYRGIRGLGESEWTGDRGPFTGPQYRKFREVLADQGIMYKNGRAKNSPWKLTRSGRNSLPYLADQLKNSTQGQPTNQPTNNFERFEHIEGE